MVTWCWRHLTWLRWLGIVVLRENRPLWLRDWFVARTPIVAELEEVVRRAGHG